MYVTASADGTLGLRCLRSSYLWNVIPNEKLSQTGVQVVSLKLSLHGYIFVAIKSPLKIYFYVYSLNGDELAFQQKSNSDWQLKFI